MECREYNYVKTRDNKRTLLLSYFTTILEEGNAVDFRFPLSEYLFSLSLSIILISSFPLPPLYFDLISKESRHPVCIPISLPPPSCFVNPSLRLPFHAPARQITITEESVCRATTQF